MAHNLHAIPALMTRDRGLEMTISDMVRYLIDGARWSMPRIPRSCGNALLEFYGGIFEDVPKEYVVVRWIDDGFQRTERGGYYQRKYTISPMAETPEAREFEKKYCAIGRLASWVAEEKCSNDRVTSADCVITVNCDS